MQLFPSPKNQPPVVFHVFPIIGNAVTYGMDPYKFLFDCREKVGSLFRDYLTILRGIQLLGPDYPSFW